jgi:hypothetical protein
MRFTLPQSDWNDASTLAHALADLSAAKDQAEAWKAYGRPMYAVGNDHT